MTIVAACPLKPKLFTIAFGTVRSSGRSLTIASRRGLENEEKFLIGGITAASSAFTARIRSSVPEAKPVKPVTAFEALTGIFSA